MQLLLSPWFKGSASENLKLTQQKRVRWPKPTNPFEYGRGERIRTFDPLVPNQMRYQAALRPEVIIVPCNYIAINLNQNIF